MLFLTFILIHCCRSGLSQSVIVERKCTENLFSKPYVILRHNKYGQDVAELETQGVIDLREAINSYICINGAVIVYSNASIHKEITKKRQVQILPHIATVNTGETIRFSDGTFKIFSHKCMHINRMSINEIRNFGHLGKKPIITSASNVLGLQVTGVFLLTTMGSYDPNHSPLIIMLNQDEFGYKIGVGEQIVEDVSFVAVGKGPFCLSTKDGSTVILSSTAKDNDNICRWSGIDEKRKEGKELYRKLFKKGYNMSDYQWKDSCPTSWLDNDLNNSKASDDESKPFAIYISSVKLGKVKTEESSEPTISSEETYAYDYDYDDAPSNYEIELKNCDNFPKFNPIDPICDYIRPDNFDCEKLTVALELEGAESQQKRKRDISIRKSPLTLKGNPTLMWKHEVLSLLAKIFSKICLPIRNRSLLQLINVIGNYIATAHATDPEHFSRYVHKTTEWDTLISRLNRCLRSNKTVPFEWTWSDKNVVAEEDEIASSEKRRRRKRSLHDDGKRKKLETYQMPSLETYLLVDENAFYENIEEVNGDYDDGDDRPKLIIQRSLPPLAVYEDELFQRNNDAVNRPMPRWPRQTNVTKILPPAIQEYIPPNKTMDDYAADSRQSLTYEDFIFHPNLKHIRVKGHEIKQIFYYEDLAHDMFELNKAIDAFWKVLASVIGFCQINEISRVSEVFPLLLQNFDDYFMNLLEDEWKNPTIEEEVEMVLGEFMDEDRARWLDTCLETSYIVANVLQYRPVRPLELETAKSDLASERTQTDILLLALKSKDEDRNSGSEFKVNSFVALPETEEDE